MRFILLAAAALALAGCAAPGTTPTPTGNDTNSTTSLAIVPPPINETKDVQGTAQPLRDPASNDPCSLPTSGCIHHAFDVASNVKMDATLTWGTPANDFDLVLYKDGKEVKSETSPPPGTSAKLAADLEPGAYDLVVVPATVGQDTYTLLANFTAA